MKLRCTSGSIRLRLLRSDIATLQQKGRILESLSLPDGGSFGFALKVSGEPAKMSAFWQNNLLTVSLPEGPARAWMDSEQVSMEAALDLPGGGKLAVLVEKDFPCHHDPAANAGETFGELVPPES